MVESQGRGSCVEGGCWCLRDECYQLRDRCLAKSVLGSEIFVYVE